MKGTFTLPGDKSISHRVAMLAAVAQGSSVFRNFNTGADCSSTLSCLSDVGAVIEREAEIRVFPHALHSPARPLNCGNSGSTIRMLTGLLAGQNIPASLTGDESLLRRPMRRIAEPLRRMGAVIDLRDEEYGPIVLKEGVKHSMVYEMPVSSAQVKSAVLFAGLRFPGTAVRENLPSRDHTERLLAWLQFPSRGIAGFDYDVPGDPSSAAFFIAGALMRPHSDLTIRSLLVNPHRIGFLRVLQRCGAGISFENQRDVAHEPVADLRVRSNSKSSRIIIDAQEVPSLIDELPVLSVLGALWGLDVRGAAELRHKESDRISVMLENLNSLGIRTQEFPDGYSIEPGRFAPAGKIRTHGDHRIAMAFAVAGFEIDDPACVNVSFPEFFEILEATTKTQRDTKFTK